jgi:hypothetical protein
MGLPAPGAPNSSSNTKREMMGQLEGCPIIDHGMIAKKLPRRVNIDLRN